MLPSAQLAHGIGVLVADAVRGGRRKKRSGTRKRQRERPHGKAWPLVQTVRARRSERPLPTWFGRAQLFSLISLRRAQLFSQHKSSYVRRLERALKKSGMDQEEIYNLDENAEYDSTDGSECSESELSVPAANV